jgi:hypothetical protein
MSVNTKTVAGYLGPKQVTREQFVKQWADHFSEFYHLPETSEEFSSMQAMKTQIAEMAGRKWDALPHNH